MKKTYLFFIVAVAAFQACTFNSENTDKQIDYATLDSLQTEVVLEIGESDDFLPGRLGNLVVISESSILVGDFEKVSIEQFDAQGNHVATIATEGNGPGEITPYFSFKNIGHDTLMVMVNQQSRKRDYYARDDNGQFQLVRSTAPQENPEPKISIQGAESDTTYYAIWGFGIGSIEEYDNDVAHRNSMLAVVDRSGTILKDSLQALQIPNTYLKQFDDLFLGFTVPFRYQDRFILLDDGSYLIARPDSNSIHFYDNKQQLQRSISLNVKPRAVTSADLEYRLNDRDPRVQNEIEAHVPQNKPPYLNIWATDKYLWLHTSSNDEGKEIVVLDYEGKPLGKFMLPEGDDIQQVSENYIYTIHESPEQGDGIRKYRVNI